MIKNKFQIILAVTAAVLITAALPGVLHAYWSGCTNGWSGCPVCTVECYFDGCNDPEKKKATTISGTTYSSNGSLVKYIAACCDYTPRSYLMGCGFDWIYSPDWTDAENRCGTIEYQCGDSWTASLSTFRWICTIDLTADKYLLRPGDEAHLTATADPNEADDYSPVWAWEAVDGNNVSVTLTPNKKTAVVSDPVGKGTVIIRAQDPNDINCYDEIVLDID